MGTDAGVKSRTTSSEQPTEASGTGKRKVKKRREAPPRASPSSSEAGLKQPVSTEAFSDSGKDRSSGQRASAGEKTATLESADASEGSKGEQSRSSLMSGGKRKRSPRDVGASEGGNKKRSSKRSNEEDVVAPETTDADKAKPGGKRSDPEPSGREVAAVVADGATAGNKRERAFKQWSEEDVIKLLEGIIECQEEHGADACSAVDIIRKHIHERQHMELSRTQLYEKIRRLKLKFESVVSRMKGDCPEFAKPHDQTVFELSKKIWTAGKVAKPVVGVDHGDDGGVGVKEEEDKVGVLYPNLEEAISQLEKESLCYMGSGLLKKGFELLTPSNAEKLEERWKANCLAGMKVLFENSKLKNELLEACVEALDNHIP